MGEIDAGPGGAPRGPERIQASHDLSSFESREPELDEWLRRRALGNEGRASRTYVVCAGNRVVGYYALAAGAIQRDAAPRKLRRNSPDPLLVMVLGRLAVDKNCEGRGIGRGMLRDAILRTAQASEIAGIAAILVHAISDRAKDFYERNGFMASGVGPLTLVLPLKQAGAALAGDRVAAMHPTEGHLLVFGLGYCGAAIARVAAAAGWGVSGTSRIAPVVANDLPGVEAIAFDSAEAALRAATHLLATAPPGEAGDPVLARYRAAIDAAPALGWIGYLSSTGVYGDRGGGWVDEDTAPAPASARARRRLAAEQDWAALADKRAVDILRLAGIYGPGRSVFDAIRAGTARRVLKPGQVFGRIHRDDIAAAVLAAMREQRPSGARVFNLADDLPAANADVIAEAARLIGAPPPPAVSYGETEQAMSETVRSFWAENRRVSSAKTKAALGLAWRYPTYREGLRAVLEQEAVERAPQ